MPGWMRHMMITDSLLESGLDVDEEAFCFGSIAPDCNVENADWTAFEPSRETTHWMTGASKLTADTEGFYQQRIAQREPLEFREFSFLLGYYAHLYADVDSVRFYRSEERLKAIFARLKQRGEPLPTCESFDALKQMYGRAKLFKDIKALENEYMLARTDSAYHRIVRGRVPFGDDWAQLPKGAIARKIGLMAHKPDASCQYQGLFCTREEYQTWLEQITQSLKYSIKQKGGWNK